MAHDTIIIMDIPEIDAVTGTASNEDRTVTNHRTIVLSSRKNHHPVTPGCGNVRCRYIWMNNLQIGTMAGLTVARSGLADGKAAQDAVGFVAAGTLIVLCRINRIDQRQRIIVAIATAGPAGGDQVAVVLT